MSGVIFVCWGNICRSPMGERVARARFEEAGLSHVAIASAGSSWRQDQHHVAQTVSSTACPVADWGSPLTPRAASRAYRLASGPS